MGALLTRNEMNLTRDMPCAGCGGIPPFENDRRCEVHRIIPGARGGQYTHGNVEPRCFPCHKKAHPFNGWLLDGRPCAERASEIARKAGKNSCKNLTPELRRIKAEAGRKGAKRGYELHLEFRRERMKQTLRENPHIAEIARQTLLNLPKERRSEIGRKAGKISYEKDREQVRIANRKSTHVRWHVKREIKNPQCELCCSE